VTRLRRGLDKTGLLIEGHEGKKFTTEMQKTLRGRDARQKHVEDTEEEQAN